MHTVPATTTPQQLMGNYAPAAPGVPYPVNTYAPEATAQGYAHPSYSSPEAYAGQGPNNPSMGGYAGEHRNSELAGYQETFWDKVHYAIGAIIHFLLSFVATVFFVVLILFWPMVIKEFEAWRQTHFATTTPQDQETTTSRQQAPINAVFPDELPEVSKTNESTVTDPDVPIIPADNRLVIKNNEKQVNINAPLIDVPNSDEDVVLKAIEKGVGWYESTAEPGQLGNAVLTAHSSYFWWKPGDYKFIFSDLWKLPHGTTMTVYWKQKKYDFTLYEDRIIDPTPEEAKKVFDQVSHQHESVITIITCHPPGTSLRRLIVRGRLEGSTSPSKGTTRKSTVDELELPRIW